MCINLKQVNTATINDNYPLPITNHAIKRVVDKLAYSLEDGLLGSNEVSKDPKDHWRIFAY